MWFTDKLLEIGDISNVFTVTDVIIVLILSTILCFVGAMVYQKVHSGISYSSDFVQTIVMFGVLVSMIMLIIGSNIARAFTLVGALSIVRFRNAIKDTKDVGFIFFMMTIGMAVGTRFYALAVIMTIFVSFLLLGMHKVNFGGKKQDDEVLKITIKDGSDYETSLKPNFSRYLSYYNLINIESSKSGFAELVYLVRFKKKVTKSTKKRFIDELKGLKEVRSVYIFGTEHLIY